MATELAEERETLRHLMRTDADPRVRHQAHTLLLVADGQTGAVARLFGTGGHRDADDLSDRQPALQLIWQPQYSINCCHCVVKTCGQNNSPP